MQEQTSLLFLMAILFSSLTVTGQVTYKSKDNLSLTLSGTSTLRNWDMKSTIGDLQAVFSVNGNGRFTDMNSMTFTIPVYALNSGIKAMDKNTLKAFKSDKYPDITMSLSSAYISNSDSKHSIVKSIVKLSIAGITLNTDLTTKMTLNADNTIVISGEKKIDMTDFKIDPPSFMLGIFKTGKNVVIRFNVIANRL